MIKKIVNPEALTGSATDDKIIIDPEIPAGNAIDDKKNSKS